MCSFPVTDKTHLNDEMEATAVCASPFIASARTQHASGPPGGTRATDRPGPLSAVPGDGRKSLCERSPGPEESISAHVSRVDVIVQRACLYKICSGSVSRNRRRIRRGESFSASPASPHPPAPSSEPGRCPLRRSGDGNALNARIPAAEAVHLRARRDAPPRLPPLCE